MFQHLIYQAYAICMNGFSIHNKLGVGFAPMYDMIMLHRYYYIVVHILCNPNNFLSGCTR